eukprot:scaffold98864_cov59-Phaeocystis_antarctica.AAC.1
MSTRYSPWSYSKPIAPKLQLLSCMRKGATGRATVRVCASSPSFHGLASPSARLGRGEPGAPPPTLLMLLLRARASSARLRSLRRSASRPSEARLKRSARSAATLRGSARSSAAWLLPWSSNCTRSSAACIISSVFLRRPSNEWSPSIPWARMRVRTSWEVSGRAAAEVKGRAAAEVEGRAAAEVKGWAATEVEGWAAVVKGRAAA